MIGEIFSAYFTEPGFLRQSLGLLTESTLFITAGLIASFILRRHSARAHQVLLLSIIAAVTVPGMSMLVRHLELGLFKTKPAIQYSAPANFAPAIFTESPATIPSAADTHPETIVQTIEPALLQSSSRPIIIPWRKIFLYGWLATTVVLLSRLAISFIHGVRLLRRARPVDFDRFKEIIRRVKAKLGINTAIEIRSSSRIPSPVIWCWRRRPVLLIPADSGRLNERIDWAGVLCHELAHFKRRDYISGLLAELMVSIFPWHLLLWWAKLRLVRLSEQACDDWVVATGQSGADYAESLLDLIPGGQMAFVPAVVNSKKGLAGRIRRILKDNCGNPRIGAAWILAVCIATILLAVGVAFAQTRPAKIQDNPAVTESEEVTEANEPMVTIDFKNVEMETIIKTLAEWTGKVIIPTEEALKQKITIYAPMKISQKKALSLIYSALRTKGFAAKAAGDVIYIEPFRGRHDSPTVPIIPEDQSLLEIKDKEQIVQKLFKLKHYNASQMGQILLPIMSEYGYISAEEKTNTLLVVESVRNLMTIEKIISQFDEARVERSVAEIFPVRYKAPSEIIRSLRTLINDQAGADSLTSALTGPDKLQVTLIPEPKRNWIIVRATPEDMNQIRKLIEKLDSREPSANELPESWSLYHDNGLTPDGGKRWPGNMAENLASLETVPRSFKVGDESWREETFEFDIRALDGARIGDISVRPESRTEQMRRKIFQPDKYLLNYTRSWGKPGNNFRMNCGPFLLDISKPGMYDLQFAPKLGEVEITGSAGGCYAVNFEKIDQGVPIQGYAYINREKEYTLDGLPPGTYRLSAVAQQQNGNVLVSRAKVTVKSEEKVTVDIAPPAKGNCTLKGTLLGRQKTYSFDKPLPHQSQGRWFVLIRESGSGSIVTTFAYEALTMDSLYVVRGDNIAEDTIDKASYKIEGIVPGEYIVTAIEHPWISGSVITRQQSKPLVLEAGKEAVLDFDLRESI